MSLEELRALFDDLGAKTQNDAANREFADDMQRLGFLSGRMEVAVARVIDANNRRLEEQLRELGILPRG